MFVHRDWYTPRGCGAALDSKQGTSLYMVHPSLSQHLPLRQACRLVCFGRNPSFSLFCMGTGSFSCPVPTFKIQFGQSSVLLTGFSCWKWGGKASFGFKGGSPSWGLWWVLRVSLLISICRVPPKLPSPGSRGGKKSNVASGPPSSSPSLEFPVSTLHPCFLHFVYPPLSFPFCL